MRKAMILFIVSLFFIHWTIGWQAADKFSPDKGSTPAVTAASASVKTTELGNHEVYNTDIKQVLNYAGQTMDDWNWVIKHAGFFQSTASTADLKSQINELGQHLNLVHYEQTTGEDEAYIQLTHNVDNMELVFRLNEIPEHQSETKKTYLTVKISGSGQIPSEKIDPLIKEVTSALNAVHIEPQWQTMVQGAIDSELEWTAIQTKLETYWSSAFDTVYEDLTTVSATMNTPLLQHAVTSSHAAESINLQAAVHRHSETGELRFTLGAPLITSEY